MLVTPAGGLAQNMVFLPAGATAIMPNVLLDDLDSRPLDVVDYNQLEYVHVQRVPVTPKDYARTSDRPHCETEASPKLRDCNIWLEDLEPLVGMVEQALHAWHLDHAAGHMDRAADY